MGSVEVNFRGTWFTVMAAPSDKFPFYSAADLLQFIDEAVEADAAALKKREAAKNHAEITLTSPKGPYIH